VCYTPPLLSRGARGVLVFVRTWTIGISPAMAGKSVPGVFSSQIGMVLSYLPTLSFRAFIGTAPLHC